jgi:hypothetical protein
MLRLGLAATCVAGSNAVFVRRRHENSPRHGGSFPRADAPGFAKSPRKSARGWSAEKRTTVSAGACKGAQPASPRLPAAAPMTRARRLPALHRGDFGLRDRACRRG